MTTGKVDFTGVQSTMLVTLFLRALDSKEKKPILGDHIALIAQYERVPDPNLRRFSGWEADSTGSRTFCACSALSSE